MLNFPYKTPSNFYGGDTGFGMVETKNEGDIWLESLPYDAILVTTDHYCAALRAGYQNLSAGLKDGVYYNILQPRPLVFLTSPELKDGEFLVACEDMLVAVATGHEMVETTKNYILMRKRILNDRS